MALIAATHNQLALLGEAEVGGCVRGQGAELQVRGQMSVVAVVVVSVLVYPMHATSKLTELMIVMCP